MTASPELASGYSPETGKKLWDLKTLQKELKAKHSEFRVAGALQVGRSIGAGVVAVATEQEPCHTDECLNHPRTPGCGLAAFRASDGSFLWHQVLIPGVAESETTTDEHFDVTIRLAAADSDRVLCAGGILPGSDTEPDYWTAGFDVSSGKQLWRVDGVVGDRLAGDVALVVEPADKSDSDYLSGSLVALDAADGRELWSTRAESLQKGRWSFGGTGFAGLSLEDDRDSSADQNRLVGSRSGRKLFASDELGMLPATGSVGTGPAGQPIAVWTGKQDDVESPWALRSWSGSGPVRCATQPLVAKDAIDDQTLGPLLAVQGTVWYAYAQEEGSDDPANDHTVPIDLWGRRLSAPIQGQAIGAGDNLLAVQDGDTVSIYRWT